MAASLALIEDLYLKEQWGGENCLDKHKFKNLW